MIKDGNRDYTKKGLWNLDAEYIKPLKEFLEYRLTLDNEKDVLNMRKLEIGDITTNGNVEIVDEDRLCYLVRNTSKGAQGLRTISKALLGEFIDYISKNPDKSANEAREALCGLTDIDKFEYGYASTLLTMAKMSLGVIDLVIDTSNVFIHSDKANKFALLVFKHLYNVDKLKRIQHLFEDKNKNKTLNDSSLEIKMYGVFIECKHEELAQVNEGKGDNYRYFNDGFDFGKEYKWYLTSGWSKPEKGKSETSSPNWKRQ